VFTIRKVMSDRTAVLIALVAMALSVSSFVITYQHGNVLLYSDGVSHMLISRRVIDSPRAGFDFGQLGSVWLPLPHIAMLPFVGFNWFYQSGFGGSIVSMVAFVTTCVLLYKLLYRFTGQKYAGIIAAAVYGLSYNMLFMQSTPMTESLLFCTMLGAVYYLTRWTFDMRAKSLLAASIWTLLATLTRYEAWPVMFAMLAVTAIAAWKQYHPNRSNLRLHYRRTEDRVIAFAVTAGIGMIGWVLYNGLIFGDPLEFYRGDYAHPPLGSNEPAVGNLWVTLKTYWFASVTCVGRPVLVLGIAGLVVFVFKTCRKVSRRGNGPTFWQALPILALLMVVPFVMLSVYTGNRPLHVEQINGEAYNVRYGLFVLVLAAIFIGYLVTTFRVFAVRLCLTLLAVLFTVIGSADIYVSHGIGAMVGIEHASNDSMNTVKAFKGVYNGKLVLMQSWGNENIAFRAVPTDKLINEGSYKTWEPAIKNPRGYKIGWIIARCGSNPDPLCELTRTKPAGFTTAFKSDDYVVLKYTDQH
jgi:hypothetical protein